ncbi:prepilin-type N-terminal cleavage/methylation domain-containing protein [Vreelandella jeotgali]|uniref:prepilin-type N-terminal cleavage/methylation domain-containing protein n=1 Tax=Vreelandella jeotgali TaxID=553386 RepID=UPI00034833ED|nr:prepilin-type N-terminal cleavage/methylation domain-containing protein [Halomonas jeotgali]
MTKQGGFTLIEALVALLILSLGMLGIAAMQLNALHSATRSYQHSVATLAAVDAQEWLWEKLEKADDCRNLDGEIESEWKDHWENDKSSNPLRNAGSLDIVPKGCTYTISIPLGSAENDDDEGYSTVTYRVRLPEK